jgi:nitroreductase
MSVAQILRSRVSIRAYADEAPSMETVRDILDAARWSPSGGNMQPWKVIVVAGRARDEVIALAHRTLAANPAGEDGDYPVQPDELHTVLRERRRLVGAQRYAVMGIERDDKIGRAAAVARNYDFWGAPVGLFFVTYRGLAHSQWAHLGMFIQSVVLVAAEKGLGSCVQEAWAKVRGSLGRHFGLPAEEMIYCGLALGYADRAQPINAFRSTRESVTDFATMIGFEHEADVPLAMTLNENRGF